MKEMDLIKEAEAAVRAVRQPHMDKLRALGIPIAFLAELGAEQIPFGVARVRPDSRGLYEPGFGEPHVIQPVFDMGVLVDLVAWRTSAPDDWCLRTGDGFALGLGALDEAGPVHFYSSPLDWLQGAGGGLCVLDWGSHEVRQLAVLDEVTVSDAETAALLRQALSRPVRLPAITITGGKMYGALAA